MALTALPIALLLSLQTPVLKPGDIAPDLKLRRIEAGKPTTEVSLSSLKGKVVVVEFWATWCIPCIRSFKHLSEVSKERPDVEFLAVTNEKADKVVAFLNSRTDIQVPVVLDEKGSASNTYGVKFIPHTVIIDKQGKIAAITQPEKVTAEALKTVAEGRDPSLPLKVDVEAKFDEVEPTAKMRLVIRESGATGAVGQRSDNRFVADGIGVSAAYQEAYDTSHFRSEFNIPKEELDQRYYFDISVPAEQKAELWPMFRAALKTTFGYKVERVIKPKKVYVLRVKQGVPLKATQSATKGSGFFKHNGMKSRGSTMDAVATFLEAVTSRVVVNETKLEGGYDFDVSWIPGNMPSLMKAYEDIGLELVEDTRDVEVVVFSKE